MIKREIEKNKNRESGMRFKVLLELWNGIKKHKTEVGNEKKNRKPPFNIG